MSTGALSVIDPATPLACPLDGLALSVSGNSWRCAGNHCYDVARAGHLNLLPVGYKPSKDPGDTRDMVLARRRVLEAGIFEPLADALAGCVIDSLTGIRLVDGNPDSLVVDAGCGDGFYTERLSRALLAHEGTGNVRVLGSDISRWAIAAAAKRHPGVSWVVANNRRLPILQGRCTLVVSLFGFETWLPWAALQHSGQGVLVAHAGPLHLIELRKVIYDTVRVHAPPTDQAALDAGYTRVGESSLTLSRTVPGPDLWADILTMTPHGHRVARGGIDLSDALAGKKLTIDVRLRHYRRA